MVSPSGRCVLLTTLPGNTSRPLSLISVTRSSPFPPRSLRLALQMRRFGGLALTVFPLPSTPRKSSRSRTELAYLPDTGVPSFAQHCLTPGPRFLPEPSPLSLPRRYSWFCTTKRTTWGHLTPFPTLLLNIWRHTEEIKGLPRKKNRRSHGRGEKQDYHSFRRRDHFESV